MKMLSGLKDLVSPKALKATLYPLGGGAGAGLLHLVLSKEVGWFTAGEYAWAKRSGLAALIAVAGGGLLKKKSSTAADGVRGAMGAVIAYEVYNRVKNSDAAKTGKAFLSNLARTEARALNGTSVRSISGAGVGVAGTNVRSMSAARYL